MFLVLRALRRPFTVLVAVLAILLSAGLAVRRAPVDIFPSLGVPVIYVVQPFGGMSPSQMEGQIVSYYEYHFLYVAGIEHIESQSIQGMAMLKLYFHPGTDIAESMAQVTAMTFRATAFMPPGTLPAFIVRYDAGSIPAGQLVFSSDRRSDAEIQDLALYRVRPVLSTIPGVSAPPPSGGKVRTIVVYADPDRMRSYGIAPDEIATTLARENLTLPAGNVRVGDFTTISQTNAMVQKPTDLESIPLRTGSGPTVYLRDVARVEDGADVVYNIALVNGRRTVYLPVTKRSDASTLDVVNALKAMLPKMRSLGPDHRRPPRRGSHRSHGLAVSARLAVGAHRGPHNPILAPRCRRRSAARRTDREHHDARRSRARDRNPRRRSDRRDREHPSPPGNHATSQSRCR